MALALNSASALWGAAEGAPPEWLQRAHARLPMLAVCTPEGGDQPALCGTLAVWENRATRQGRKIELAVVVIPSRGANPAPDPVLYLAGGPGGSSTALAPVAAEAFPQLLAERDLLLIDQRGTGRSHPLRCDTGGQAGNPASFMHEVFPLERLRACLAEFQQKADLTQYTSAIAIEDFDEVRRWLGYGKINLFGGSYGTRTAQEYLLGHSEALRAVLLQGVAGMDQRLPLYHARDGQRALDLVFSLCAADDRCRAAFPNVRAELGEVLTRLAAAPVQGELPDGEGKKVAVTLTRGIFAESLRGHLYSPSGAAEVPYLIHQAYLGHFQPFLQATVRARNIELALAAGLHFAVTCSEDSFFFTPEDVARETAGTFLADYRAGKQLAVCGFWPRAPVDPATRQPVASEVPVLMLVGNLDPVTPPIWAERAKARMPNARLVVLEGGAHGFDGLEPASCAEGLMTAFLRAGSAVGLDTGCLADLRFPPFVLEEKDTLHGRREAEAGR